MSDRNELLRRKRIALINGEIREETVNNLVPELLRLEADNPTEDINLYVNSPGGSVTQGMAIHDVMHMVQCDVSTICFGQACSMAAIILMAGTRGKRFISPNARVLIHQPSGGAFGTASEVETAAQEITRLKTLLIRLTSHYTGKDEGRVAIDMQRDFYMGPEAAVEYGIVDEIRGMGSGLVNRLPPPPPGPCRSPFACQWRRDPHPCQC
ncbi:MAG: ATP-dependent Clp protease proteolytic subunit, partial [Chloroflexi bacterium]|nr:ATP-dependent Clp protease proteolytic subunit [Chloroflexota bacterium]